MTSRALVQWLGGLIRHLWVAIGIALLIVLCAELLYRGQAAVKTALRREPAQEPVPHPYAGETWWREWQDGGARWQMGFDPYRALWARPGSSKYVNIDSLGRRATTDPAPEVGKSAMVYMFGGSAMFGYTARDAYTIPSLVAAELVRRGHPEVGVLNFAQPSFNLTQDVNTLVLELRARRIPSIAVFMDGNNEVAPPFYSGRVGSILNEDSLARRLTGPQRGLADVVMDHLLLAQRLRTLTRPPVAAAAGGDQTLCSEIAEQYLALAAIARNLGREYQFPAVFFWQPMFATTGKPPTAWESSIATTGGADGERWRAMVTACTKTVDDLARERSVEDYYPLHHLFDEEGGTVFIDDYGHMVESAHTKVAVAIVDRILERLPVAPRHQ